jgi:pimeloyl-ACP methyl ester carboxylesterase
VYVEVDNARVWVEDGGDGPPILFLHGGLGDRRLFDPQRRALADAFRCVAYDRGLWGRSETPSRPVSFVDEAVGVLDALEIEQASLVGLSMGGGLALDVAAAHPDRVRAVVHVAGGASGMPVDPYTPEQNEVFESGTLAEKMAADFAVWAPLGSDAFLEELWLATPDARELPDDLELRQAPPLVPEEIAQPTLVVLARHDPPAQQAVGRELARRLPGARLAEVDSDHYLTLREPELVTGLIREFLAV